MKYKITSKIAALFLAAACLLSLNALADDVAHKVVIQVNSNDEQTQKIALNNAVNLQKLYGIDNVQVEVVAYGPGLSILTKKSKQVKRVESLAMQEIKFSACGNTMKKIEKKSGKKPTLADGVEIVTAGVGRIVELQEQGWSYIKP